MITPAMPEGFFPLPGEIILHLFPDVSSLPKNRWREPKVRVELLEVLLWSL